MSGRRTDHAGRVEGQKGSRCSRRRTTALVGLTTALVGLVLGVPSAVASPHAVVSWSLPHTVNEGAAIPFSWTGNHLGRKYRLVIQRPMGTARTWKSIMRLPSKSGATELPSMTLGKYRLRLAALRGHRVLAQQAVGIGVFGQVPFSALFGDYNYNRVYATPQYSFPYVTAWEPDADQTVFTVQHNHCRSVHIAFVPGEHNGNAVGTVTLVQESRDPVTVSAPADTIASLDAELVPGQSWSVNASDEHAVIFEIYFNGYAICDSTESFFS